MNKNCPPFCSFTAGKNTEAKQQQPKKKYEFKEQQRLRR